MKTLKDNPSIEIVPGITRRTLVHGETMYQMRATLAAGSVLPAHQHPQEQIIHILRGRMRLLVEGGPHELETGDSFYLASNISHGVETIEETIVLDTFSPREPIISRCGLVVAGAPIPGGVNQGRMFPKHFGDDIELRVTGDNKVLN